MSESYEFNVFNDKLKRRFLIDQILQSEVQIFTILLEPLDQSHPDYEEWKYQLEDLKSKTKNLKDVYVSLGGSYDIQELSNVFNNA